jgi:hypothetical protein
LIHVELAFVKETWNGFRALDATARENWYGNLWTRQSQLGVATANGSAVENGIRLLLQLAAQYPLYL